VAAQQYTQNELTACSLHLTRAHLRSRLTASCPAGDASRPTPGRDGQLQFPRLLPPGNVTATLAFSYPLSKGLLGFYTSSYETTDGKKHMLAGTQFESMSARKALPCLDEPALKVRAAPRPLCARACARG
jgi:aminopeptidase N